MRKTLIIIPAVLAAAAALDGCATMSGQGPSPVATWLRDHQARVSLESATWHALTGHDRAAPMRILDRWFRGRQVYWIAAVDGRLYKCVAGVTNRATCVRVSGWTRETTARTDRKMEREAKRFSREADRAAPARSPAARVSGWKPESPARSDARFARQLERAGGHR